MHVHGLQGKTDELGLCFAFLPPQMCLNFTEASEPLSPSRDTLIASLRPFSFCPCPVADSSV